MRQLTAIGTVASKTSSGSAHTKSLRLLSLLLAGVALHQPAFGQEAGDADTSQAQSSPDAQGSVPAEGSGDIIVTAQKRSERLSDVPLSVSAATGEQLALRGITGPADLEKIVPGFLFRPSAYGQPIYQIRGIGFFEESYAVPPTVSVYVDQVPVPFAAMTEGASLDVERVEVLKGPQGTLFGQNSTGGAINYIAAKPTSDLRAGFEAKYGRFSEASLSGYISGPISNTISARLSAKIDHRGDWQRSYTRVDGAGNAVVNESDPRTLGRRDFIVGRLLLDWQPSDKLKFEFNFNGWRNRSDTQAYQYIEYRPIYPAADRDTRLEAVTNIENYPLPPKDARYAGWDADRSFRRNDSFYALSLRGDLELSDNATLTSITSYSDLSADRPLDNDGTEFPSLGVRSVGALSSFSQELRLAGTGFDNRLNWMVGGNLQRDRTSEAQNVSFIGTNTVLRLPDQNGIIQNYFFEGTENRTDRNDTDTNSVFASVDFKPDDRFSVYASVRYSADKHRYAGCLADDGTGGTAAAFSALSNLLTGGNAAIGKFQCITLTSAPTAAATGGVFGAPIGNVESEFSENNLSWRAGVSFKPTPDAMIYANVTKGYKAGTYATIALVFDTQAIPVKQESVLAYEAGIKLSLLNRMLQIDGAIYHLSYDNKQLGGVVFTPPFGNLATLVQVPKSRVNGAEVSMTVRPSRGLALSGSVSYVDSKVLSDFFSVDPFGGSFENRKGDPFPGSPKWQATGDVSYAFPVRTGWDALLGASLTYRSATRSYFGNEPIGVVEGYSLVDLRAGVESDDGKYSVQLWAKNVFNKFYTQTTNKILDTAVRSVGMPATYGVTFRTAF